MRNGQGFWSWRAPAGSITERPILESGDSDRHWKLLPDFKLQRTGITVYRDTRQGDAWQRYWRAQGMKEPSWSPRHGHYLEKLPSEWPPEHR